MFTEILNNESNLRNCFDNSDDIETQTNNWLKELNNIFHRCFKKIRVSNKVKEIQSSLLLKQRTDLIQEIKRCPENTQLKEQLDKVTSDLADIVSEENRDKLFKNFKSLDQSEGENFAQGIWNLKKKEFLKILPSVPAAKTDINGRTVTDPTSIKKLYLDTFCHRLCERPIKDDNAELFKLQQNLLFM